ncbi:hypothetical protein GCM10023213_28850 [Prosthecobacter algae]|uniref:Uncharacterized protein n=1 Tax=Prosthecobacter algae TaxID=1144682 RepID=A0ABP9PC67_9BACT
MFFKSALNEICNFLNKKCAPFFVAVGAEAHGSCGSDEVFEMILSHAIGAYTITFFGIWFR